MDARRWFCTLGLAVTLVVGLSGCTEEGRLTENNKTVLEHVKTEDPVNAIRALGAQLRSSDPDFLSVCDRPSWCGDSFYASRDALYNALAERLERLDAGAASALPTDQLLTLMRDRYLPHAAKEAVAAMIVSRATEAAAAPESIALLNAAGRLLLAGELVLRNADSGRVILERSWLAGSGSAARELAGMYLKVGDARNAYLWSVRQRSPGWTDYGQIKDLSKEDIRLAESAAEKAKVLSIP